MLTIKPPMQLAVNSSMIKNNNSMVERMEANYQVLVSSLHPEMLIHYIAGQPEISIEGDSMTSLITIHNKINTQQINVELINNVLNRLLVANTQNMRYQDRVFVDMVLNKIGITDINEFVRNVVVLKQNTNNVNELVNLYEQNNEALQQIHQYKNQMQHKQLSDAKVQKEQSADEKLWLHQEIMNRLQTGTIYMQMQNFYKSVTDVKKEINPRELQISEQIMQSQNMVLNQMKNQVLREEEPLEYRIINWYEMGDDNQINVQEEQIRQELVEAVILNAIHHSYALRFQEISTQSNVWYDMLKSVEYAVENTLQRFEDYHMTRKVTHEQTNAYHQLLQENATNEIVALRQLYENYEPTLLYKEERIQENTEEIQQTIIHGQQINYLSSQEETLKQQLQTINQINIEKQKQLQQVMQNLQPIPKLQINRAKALADAQRTLENPQEVLLEYQNTDSIVEHYETEKQRQLEKVIDKNILKIFETIEKYHGNVQAMPENVSVNDTALEFLIQDARVTEATREIQIEKIVDNQVKEQINNKKELQIKSQLEQLIKKEPIKERYVKKDAQIELIHKVTENEVNEEVIEELRNVNRNITRNVEEYTETIMESSDTYKSITNRMNYLQLQQNEELTNLIASNVKEQLGNLSEQVYRKLEKRMDSERRRRGL